MSILTWTDHPGGSIRSDGAKVSEFCFDGKREIWGYPPNWRPRGLETLRPVGPFANYGEAKAHMDQWLGMVD
jgi:hypothetical protein